MKHADWIIDIMGKDRGHGGKILFKGIPKELIACKKLIPARTLRESVP
jgi:excinuclease UvrABC ATPase subunit